MNLVIQFLLAKAAVVAFYLVVWLVTRHLYRKHKQEIQRAVDDERAQPAQVKEESHWFYSSTLALAIMTLIGIFIPFGWWLMAYVILTTGGFVAIASFNESMLRSSIRAQQYES